MICDFFSLLHKNDSGFKALNIGLKIYRAKYFDSDKTFKKLQKRYADKSSQTISDYLKQCKRANKFGVEWIERAAIQQSNLKEFVRIKEIQFDFEQQMIEQFPWIDKFNLSSIYNRECHSLLIGDD